MNKTTNGSVWFSLFEDDPAYARKMELWSLREMNKELLIKQCEDYFIEVYQNVDTADTEPVLTTVFEILYGKDVWDSLNSLSEDKDDGKPFDPPKLLDEHTRKAYDINPEGKPPSKSCKWCKTDGQDWRGVDTENLKMTCDFCKHGGQDW